MDSAAVLPILGTTFLPSQNSHVSITTHTALDALLNPGIDAGRITCISGDRGSGKSLIALWVLVSFLAEYTEKQAVVLDTTGTFDVVRLHRVAVTFLRGMENEGGMQGDVDDRAEMMLEQVRIVRVFDFVGVVEALKEVREEMQSNNGSGDVLVKGKRVVKSDIIPDSEDEEDDVEIDVSVPVKSENGPKVGCIVLDNFTSVMNPLFKSNHIQAHATLTAFLHSFSQFTQEHNILSILLNSVTPNQTNRTFTLDQDPINEQTLDPINHPSIFAGNNFKPALGKSFSHGLDLHILLSKLPKYPPNSRIGTAENTRPEMVSIAEIILDRFGNRTGTWTDFTITNGCEIKAVK